MNEHHQSSSVTVIAVIVTYFPSSDFLNPLLATLLLQTHAVIVVDNTPGPDNPDLTALIQNQSESERCILLRLKENLGIATAINLGCERAQELGADFVLLSDQDSLPEGDMIELLLEAYSDLVKNNINVGAVGPTYTNLVTGLTHSFQVQLPNKLFYSYAAAKNEYPYVEVLSLITSGSLIPIESLTQIGPMREDFFIDLVDIEWCHRATSRGYRLFGSGRAKMHQRMGEKLTQVWCCKWRARSLYSPLRIYYQIRNFVALWKMEIIDWRWKLHSSWFKLGLLYIHIFFSPYRLQILKMTLKGLADGLGNRMGKHPNQDDINSK